MRIEVISESGLDEALLGLGLSFGKTSDMTLEDVKNDKDGVRTKLLETARKLAPREGGHNKFLRCITVTLDCRCPMFWWKQADTYKVGTTAQSESTMHTIVKRQFVDADFEPMTFIELQRDQIRILNMLRHDYHELVAAEKLEKADNVWRDIIKALPHSFLQRRIVTMNYQVLRTMLKQRKGHKLGEWATFRAAVLNGVQHPEFLEGIDND